MKRMTYNQAVIIFVRVGLHIPDDLMSKELRKLGSLNDVALHIAQVIISERLHNLRDIEERHVNRVAFQCPHSILNQRWMILICRHEVCHSGDWVHR